MRGTLKPAVLAAALIWPAAAPGAAAAPGDIERSKIDSGKTYQGVRQQQGRVQTDSDSSDQSGKVPQMRKFGDVTLKRGVISRNAAREQRRALAPLKERISTRGMRTAEAAYTEELRLWAVRQDRRLLELQRLHSAYDRLKDYRDNAAFKGDDVSRIDPRLEEMERKKEKLSEDVRLGIVELQDLMRKQEKTPAHMSSLSRQRHDHASTLLRNMNDETSAGEEP